MTNTPNTDILNNRLALLPAKTATPFRRLLAAGQLTEEIVHTVIDAGYLAEDTAKLLGFAAGYLHLRQQGVPVHDVIAMAKTHGTRLNLAWSAARWKDEHDKLSRLEALKRLAEENVTYDLSQYDKHLPDRFPGYLIRSSRRLGMEGLRQRHCVASYHDRLKTGSSAIAAVFVDKKRWTTELQLTGDPKAPLRITQIRTRYNVVAPQHIRTIIFDLLRIEPPSATTPAPAGDRQQKPLLYMENLRRILPLLRQHRVLHVEVTFDGSGDSGSIDDIAFLPQDRLAAIQNLNVIIQTASAVHDDGSWHYTITDEQQTLEGAIEQLTYDYLDETNVNWYDNEGGFGRLLIDVGVGSVSMEVNTRYTEHTTEFSEERDIESGEFI